MSDTAEIVMAAKIDVPFLTPEGARIWHTSLLRDQDTHEGRQVLHIEAVADTEEAARQMLRLVAERLRAALEDLSR